MDVIDRQAVRLIEIDDKSARNYQTYNLDDAYDDGFWNAIFAVLELPSAEPDVIHCRDCKYFEQYKDDGTFESVLKMHQWDGECSEWVGHTYMGWFCSRAERRTDE